jgi:hypothetical protein
VQVRHRTLALGVFHEHLTRERHHRVRVPSSATTGTASRHAAATAKSTSSQAARQYPTMRTRIKITGERAAGTGVCDRHRLTAMAGQPTPTFRGRPAADRLRSSRPQSTRPGSCDLLADRSRHQTRARTAGVHARGLVASPPGLAGGCKLTRRYREPDLVCVRRRLARSRRAPNNGRSITVSVA